MNFVERILAGADIEADHRFLRRDLPAGSAEWIRGMDGRIAGLMFTCPCGCGEIGHLPVVEGYAAKAWTWDGNEAAPTLQPSVLRLSPCAWHGYLVKGEWRTC